MISAEVAERAAILGRLAMFYLKQGVLLAIVAVIAIAVYTAWQNRRK